MSNNKYNQHYHYPKQRTRKNSNPIWGQLVLIVCTILAVLIVLSFIGVQPLAAYKDSAISKLSTLIPLQNINGIPQPNQPTGINLPVIDEMAIAGTINGYYSAYNSESFDKCLDYLSSKTLSTYDARDIISATSIHRSITGEVNIQIKKTTITGNKASVSIYMKTSKTFMGMSADMIEAPLVKENGQWKISWKVPGMTVQN